ncbi:Alpha/Beta hydrolase protein [Flagelloscypha sp. PMI_526]|nr:Alpha/Beta hydrolase protein [Flagelloscypha sp. PMI_526]
MFKILGLVIACLSIVQGFQQATFEIEHPTLEQNTTSNLRLSSLVNHGGEFTVLTRPEFPGHQVRIRKSNFCDPTVNVYTGYLDVSQGSKHMFFYFFESRHDPAQDDLVMWINGGPGCSSSLGLLMENGPCSIDMTNTSPNGTNWNPFSWNKRANIFFLDQPVGVGFSYADYGISVETTEDASKDIYSFLSIFLETFPEFANRPVHLSGESYGGRYLPVFASEIVDQNERAKVEGRATINLQSVLIGNGITDISTLYPGRLEIGCGKAALDAPFIPIKDCVRMRTALPRCQTGLEASCIDTFDEIGCRSAGIDTNITYASCSDPVAEGFESHMDKWAHSTQFYVSGLLERGIRVLIYAGTWDWQCNWLANKLWVDRLEWSGRSAWGEAPLRMWGVGKTDVISSNTAAGEVKEVEGLTFATIWGAGHMITVYVPYDKPLEASVLLDRWLSNQSL